VAKIKEKKRETGEKRLFRCWKNKNQRLETVSQSIANDSQFQLKSKTFRIENCSQCLTGSWKDIRSYMDSIVNGTPDVHIKRAHERCFQFCNEWGIELLRFCANKIQAQPPFYISYVDGQPHKVPNKHSRIKPSFAEFSFYDKEMYASMNQFKDCIRLGHPLASQGEKILQTELRIAIKNSYMNLTKRINKGFKKYLKKQCNLYLTIPILKK
jgi:hypothetical protein